MDGMENNGLTNAAATVADDVRNVDVTPTRKTRAPRAPRVPSTVPTPRNVRTFDDVVTVARTITPDTAADVFRRYVPAVDPNAHASRNVGRFTNRRIGDFQNVVIRDFGATMDAVQIAFVFNMEHPNAVGDLYRAGTVAERDKIARGVVREYNAAPDHHRATWTVTPVTLPNVPAIRDGGRITAA
jgi:hypothetical protein